VVKAALRRGADVHAWAFPNRLETFQDLNLSRVVLAFTRAFVALRGGHVHPN
jgi:hypothetical protein